MFELHTENVLICQGGGEGPQNATQGMTWLLFGFIICRCHVDWVSIVLDQKKSSVCTVQHRVELSKTRLRPFKSGFKAGHKTRTNVEHCNTTALTWSTKAKPCRPRHAAGLWSHFVERGVIICCSYSLKGRKSCVLRELSVCTECPGCSELFA